jgi:DNA-binding MarR family transcriptional regulator
MDEEMPRLLSGTEAQAWQALSLVTRLVDDALDHRLQRDAGVSRAYFDVLVALSEAPAQRLRMSDLAHRLRFSQSRVTHAVASMERRGWVVRQASPDDRRGHFATLANGGKAVLEAVAPLHAHQVRSLVFDRLNAGQRAQLEAICQTLLVQFDCVVEDPRQPGGTLGRQ